MFFQNWISNHGQRKAIPGLSPGLRVPHLDSVSIRSWTSIDQPGKTHRQKAAMARTVRARGQNKAVSMASFEVSSAQTHQNIMA